MSIFKALRRAFSNAEDLPPHHGIAGVPHHKRYCFVASIRDPFTRAVSMWRLFGWHVPSPWWDDNRYRMRDICVQGGFRAFLTDPWLRSMGIHAPIWPQLEASGVTPNYYIRYERLRHDVNKLPFLNGRKLKLEHHHKSVNPEPWHTQYDGDDLTDAVLEIYAADFEKLGYSTELKDYI
jgi:hypothetical protein